MPVHNSQFSILPPRKRDFLSFNVEAKGLPEPAGHDGTVRFAVAVLGASKVVAGLRAMKTDDNLLLMHPDMDAGHGGVSGRISAVSGDGPRVCILVAIGG